MADITIDFEERDGTQPIRARFSQCCPSPEPRVSRNPHMPAPKADLYCYNCQATYGVISWEEADGER